MSNTLTFKSPLPHQTVQLSPDNEVTSDASGLCTVTAGSEMAKALVSFGWTVVAALPTADPYVAGAIWNSSGTITISAG